MNPALRATTYATYATMLFLGLGITIVGSAARNIGLTPEQIGLMISAQHLGFVLSVLVTGALADSCPKTRLLVVGSVILGGSFLGLYQSGWFALNLAIMLISGIGIGVYEGTTDALLLDLHQQSASRHININHLFSTLGMALITFLLIFLQSLWRWAVVPAGLIVLSLSLFFWRVRIPARRRVAAPFFRKLGAIPVKGLVAILFLATVLAVGIELGTVGFLTTFLMDSRGYSQVGSKIGLVLFLAGIAGGRLLLGLIVKNQRLVNWILTLFGSAVVCFSSLYYLNEPALMYPLIVLAGLTVSALCPLIICLAGLIGRDAAGAVIGLIKVAIPTGGMVLPFAVSMLSRWTGSLTISLIAFPGAALLGFLSMYLIRDRLASLACEQCPDYSTDVTPHIA